MYALRHKKSQTILRVEVDNDASHFTRHEEGPIWTDTELNFAREVLNGTWSDYVNVPTFRNVNASDCEVVQLVAIAVV